MQPPRASFASQPVGTNRLVAHPGQRLGTRIGETRDLVDGTSAPPTTRFGLFGSLALAIVGSSAESLVKVLPQSSQIQFPTFAGVVGVPGIAGVIPGERSVVVVNPRRRSKT